MPDATPTSLYRYYDGRGVLLYVGITSRGLSRNAEHNKTQPWWPYVASQDVQHYDSRELAHKAERNLIRRRRPPFNIQHNPDRGALAATYIKLRESEKPGRSPGVVMSENKGRLRMEVAARAGNLIRCVAVEEDVSLAALIDLTKVWFNRFSVDNGFVGHVLDSRRFGFSLEMTIRGGWLTRVDAVNAIIDRKSMSYYVRTLEFEMDGQWYLAKPLGRTDTDALTADGGVA